MPKPCRGRCLCGGVQYEIAEPIVYLAHCHCARCRRFHGAAMSTYAPVPPEALRITQGKHLLRTYPVPDGQPRTFCRNCGSSLFANMHATGGDMISVAAGTLEDDPGVRPRVHLYTGDKAPWFDIADDLPQLIAEWE